MAVSTASPPRCDAWRIGFKRCQRVGNPTDGSPWIIQILSTRETDFPPNPTHGSGWLVQILFTWKTGFSSESHPTQGRGWVVLISTRNSPGFLKSHLRQ